DVSTKAPCPDGPSANSVAHENLDEVANVHECCLLPCLSISIILGVWPMSRRKEKKWCRVKFEGRVWPKTTALEAAGAEMIGHQDIYVSMEARPLLGLLNASGGLLTYNMPVHRADSRGGCRHGGSGLAEDSPREDRPGPP